MAQRTAYCVIAVALYISFGAVTTEKRSDSHRAKVHLIVNKTKTDDSNIPPPTKAPPTRPPRTAPPPPPPPKSCDDEGKCAEKNKKCNAELKCVCDVHFREISDGSCVQKPQLGESCFDNVTWLECDGQGVDPNCFSAEGPEHGKCVCAKGHAPSKTDKNCSPITKKLGETCGNDAECVIAYSACQKGKCTCIDGFSLGDDGTCKPAAYRCPSGQPKKGKGGSPVPCEVDFNDATGSIGDNCGSGQFCFVPPHTLSNLGKPRGHCCPTPASADAAQLVCPFGDPLANVTCADKKSSNGKAGASTCPQYSHQCFAVQQRPHDMICCPNPCRQSVSHFDFSGQCFDYVLLGRACELAAQCTGDAECVQAGSGGKVCKCKKGYNQVSANQCEESSRR